MSHEQQFLADLVHDWVTSVLPHQPAAARRAAAVAVRAYSSGASVSEACLIARQFVESWARHPANQRRRVMSGPVAA